MTPGAGAPAWPVSRPGRPGGPRARSVRRRRHHSIATPATATTASPPAATTTVRSAASAGSVTATGLGAGGDWAAWACTWPSPCSGTERGTLTVTRQLPGESSGPLL